MNEAGLDTQARCQEDPGLPAITLYTEMIVRVNLSFRKFKIKFLKIFQMASLSIPNLWVFPLSEPWFIDNVLGCVLAGGAGVHRGPRVYVLLVAQPPAGLGRDPEDEQTLVLIDPHDPASRLQAPARAVEAAGKVVVRVEDTEVGANWFSRTAGPAVSEVALDMDTSAVHLVTTPQSAIE